MEQADVVVVGARLAGCALAAPLARAGRKVVVLDRMTFPSDQLSTHVLLPAGTSELSQMGALAKIMALNPSQVRYTYVTCDGASAMERLRPAPDGIDFGVCVPRDQQDVLLVEAAREQGADVREGCTFTGLHWRAGRVSGIHYTDADGIERDIAASLVVGADGRRSRVAAAVGAYTPYRASRNGRGLVFRYMDDPSDDPIVTTTYYELRERESFCFIFPSAPRGRILVLFMGDRAEAAQAKRDPEGYWKAKLAQHPGARERLFGVDPATYSKVRHTGQTPAFFRASSGPGWALAGDAGHFKDPVTGQGMRDAMYMGRTLAEHILPVLDDAPGIDRATRRWELARDRHCLPAYHFANHDTRVEVQSPVIQELINDAGRTEDADVSDLFGRARTLQQIAPLPRLARATAVALIRGHRPRRETITRLFPDLRTELEIRRETLTGRFRPARTVTGSDHPGAVFPAPPTVREAAADAKQVAA